MNRASDRHSHLHRCRDLAEFNARPHGSCIVGANFAYFFVDPAFTGFSLWGVPSCHDTPSLHSAMDVVLGEHGARHLSLIDTSGLRGVDPSAFECMVSYLARRFGELEHVIERQAIIRPSGLIGSLVAGFYPVLNPPYPVAVFADLGSASAWLGRPVEVGLRELLAEMSTLTAPDALVAAVQRDLLRRVDTPTIEQCARSLALSPRTLQRRLSLCGTTFARELKIAQVRRAQLLMRAGQRSLASVAVDVGCSSPQRFSTLFRQVTGLTPTRWLRADEQENEPACHSPAGLWARAEDV